MTKFSKWERENLDTSCRSGVIFSYMHVCSINRTPKPTPNTFLASSSKELDKDSGGLSFLWRQWGRFTLKTKSFKGLVFFWYQLSLWPKNLEKMAVRLRALKLVPCRKKGKSKLESWEKVILWRNPSFCVVWLCRKRTSTDEKANWMMSKMPLEKPQNDVALNSCFPSSQSYSNISLANLWSFGI